MSQFREWSFSRYLAAKTSVDDRALNRYVWNTLMESLPRPESARPLRILEVGAGIGTMVERWLTWSSIQDVHYTALDVNPANVVHMRHRLPAWATQSGWDCERNGDDGALMLTRADSVAVVAPVVNDFFALAAHHDCRRCYDLLIAHAFMDLVDTRRAIAAVWSVLKPGGLFYATLVFDGATILLPTLEADLDATIVREYHATMDERVNERGEPSGDSCSGRHLLGHLVEARAPILAAGSSDWVVVPQQGAYPHDEAYFLHVIVETVSQALQGRAGLDQVALAEWIRARHAQIERGELIYIAHQLDVLARAPSV
jgi:SAM-dependent methyltransferase